MLQRSALDRQFDFVAGADPKLALAQRSSVRAAFEVLSDHPLLCRVAEDGRREPMLSRGKHGFIAKYRWLPAEDLVLILAVMYQREAGYTDELECRSFAGHAIDGRIGVGCPRKASAFE